MAAELTEVGKRAVVCRLTRRLTDEGFGVFLFFLFHQTRQYMHTRKARSFQILSDYEKRIVAFDEPIRAYNVEFPAPDLSDGFTEHDGNPLAPSWRVVSYGLNIEYRCENCNNYPIIRKGLGTFNAVDASIGHTCFANTCRHQLFMRNVTCYWLWECLFEFNGILAETESRISGKERFDDGRMYRTRGDTVRYLQLTLITRPY